MRETFDLFSTIQIHANGPQHIFEGMASIFGAPVQAYIPTKIDRGAFTRSLQESGSRVVLLNQHDVTEPIGKPVELRETDSGLYLRGRLSRTRKADEVWTLMTDGILDGLSIGFNAKDTYNEVRDGETWRHISDLDLMEISLVTFPADALARVTATHGIQLAPSHADREAQLAELQRIAEQWRAGEIPDFREVFGAGWRV
jgi:HK97 family phage prohead protease